MYAHTNNRICQGLFKSSTGTARNTHTHTHTAKHNSDGLKFLIYLLLISLTLISFFLSLLDVLCAVLWAKIIWCDTEYGLRFAWILFVDLGMISMDIIWEYLIIECFGYAPYFVKFM